MQVESSDGTVIHADEFGGEGPAVLFVPGSTLDASAATRVCERLAARFRCFAMDRRGRGQSGDSAVHSLGQEVDDVLALCRAIGRPVALFGHSYGGLCALQAARDCPELDSLILYEPPFGARIPLGIPEAMRAALDAGDARTAMLLFLEKVVRAPRLELAFVKGLGDAWFEARARTTVREVEAVVAFDAERALALPQHLAVSALVGSKSPRRLRESTDRLRERVPQLALHELEGQGHNALLFAPELVARVVETHMEDLGRERGSLPRERC